MIVLDFFIVFVFENTENETKNDQIINCQINSPKVMEYSTQYGLPENSSLKLYEYK